MSDVVHVKYEGAYRGLKTFTACKMDDLRGYGSDFFSNSTFDCDAHWANKCEAQFRPNRVTVAAHKSLLIERIEGSDFGLPEATIRAHGLITVRGSKIQNAHFNNLKMEELARLLFLESTLNGIELNPLTCGEGAFIHFSGCTIIKAKLPSLMEQKYFNFADKNDLRQSGLTFEQLAACYVATNCLLPEGITHEQLAEERLTVHARKNANKSLAALAGAAPDALTTL